MNALELLASNIALHFGMTLVLTNHSRMVGNSPSDSVSGRGSSSVGQCDRAARSDDGDGDVTAGSADSRPNPSVLDPT